MLTQKLLAAVGLAGALLLSVAAPAEARGWGGGGFHRGPVYGGPVYRGVDWRRPVYGPVYRGVDRRRAEWIRMHGRFGYRIPILARQRRPAPRPRHQAAFALLPP